MVASPSDAATIAQLEVFVERVDHLIEVHGSAVRDEQPTIDQDPLGEGPEVSNLGQEILAIWNICQNKITELGLIPAISSSF